MVFAPNVKFLHVKWFCNKNNVACFKPQDEEPFADCNPRGLSGEIGSGQVNENSFGIFNFI